MKSKRQPPQTTLENTLLGLALVGLAFSALLFAEYQSPGAVCSVGSGCDAVRTSAYSSIAGVSLPTLGIGYFLVLIAATVLPAARQALPTLAAAGAIAGLAFVMLQAFVIGAFCPLCLVVDSAAVGAGIAALLLRGGTPTPLRTGRLVSVALLAILALSAPTLVESAGSASTTTTGGAGADTSATVPGFVTRAQQEAEGVAIVEFVDFECPACRAQHRMFRQAFAQIDVPVQMVYLNLPLPMHEHAADAARAYVCAEDAGYGPDMAEELFDTEDLSPRGIQAIAADVGLDPSWFGRCLVARSTAERLDRDLSWAQQAGASSLPTFWIGQQRYVGVTEPAWVIDGVESEAAR